MTVEEDPLRIKVYNRAGEMTGVVCGPDGTGSVTDLAADRQNRILSPRRRCPLCADFRGEDRGQGERK